MDGRETRAAWQPIETAPKDGTWVLLCMATNADGEPVGADAWGVFVQVAAWWEGDVEWVVYCSMVRDPGLHFTPTHWAPLPAPPSITSVPEAPSAGRRAEAPRDHE